MTIKEKKEAIKITDTENNRVYVLDFDLESIKYAQNNGFLWEEIDTRSATLIPLIWYTLFRRHEKNVSMAEAEKLLKRLGGMSEALIVHIRQLWEQTLAPLYADEEDTYDPKATGLIIEM